MKKLVIAVMVTLLACSPAYAGNKHWKHGHGGNHNNWQNGNNNYYHGGNKYYYGGGYGGGYDYFYQDPGFWGGVVGGIVGGAIAGGGGDNYVPAPMAPQCIVQPYKVWDDYQGWVIQYRQICN